MPRGQYDRNKSNRGGGRGDFPVGGRTGPTTGDKDITGNPSLDELNRRLAEINEQINQHPDRGDEHIQPSRSMTARGDVRLVRRPNANSQRDREEPGDDGPSVRRLRSLLNVALRHLQEDDDTDSTEMFLERALEELDKAA